MVDITVKNYTLRIAKVQAVVGVSKLETIQSILQKRVPKGDVFECARVAALFAVKRTAEIIPDCHPIPVEYAHVSFQTDGLDIIILVTVKTIYKTGVEVEAMHAATVAALTVYDMLKPLDSTIEIRNVRLIEKTGGKKDIRVPKETKANFLVVSNAIFSGKKADTLTELALDKLKDYGISIVQSIVLPDDATMLSNQILTWVQMGAPLILISGGTGLVPTDITPQVLSHLIDTPIPGIAEAMRSYGQQRSPKAMFSRSMAGYIKNTLVLVLPGSKNGLSESIDAIFPAVLDAVR